MKRLSYCFYGCLIIQFILLGWPGKAPAASIKELIAAAKGEGSIEFYGPAVMSKKGAQDLMESFNRKYGLNIKMNYSPAGGMTRDVGKLISQASAGVPPEWDLFVATDSQHGRLWLKKLHEQFDYAKLGVNPEWISYDNGAVYIAHTFSLPAYNKKKLSAVCSIGCLPGEYFLLL